MNWQPIETAPNRIPVLVHSTLHGVVIAYRTSEVWSRDLGYAVDDEHGSFYIATPQEAGLTHWMSLPEPPPE